MKQSEQKYTTFEKKILILLYNTKIERNTGEIANELGISWATANKYLNILYDKSQVVKRNEGNRVYWMYWTQFMDLPDEEKEKWWGDEERAVLSLPPVKKFIQTTLEDV
jgi:predicted transcriptional regulator